MCTLSWCHSKNKGYTLYFNRDEQKSRPIASCPEIFEVSNCKIISPTDPVGGGSWIVLNESGCTHALLNLYEAQESFSAEGKISRGALVRKFGHNATYEDLEQDLYSSSLHDYLPFQYFYLDPNFHSYLYVWNGKELLKEIVVVTNLPISSSSYKTKEVLNQRKRIYPSNPDAQSLWDYHRSKGLVKNAHSVLMNREDAMTHSICKIEVTRNECSMAYTAVNDADLGKTKVIKF